MSVPNHILTESFFFFLLLRFQGGLPFLQAPIFLKGKLTQRWGIYTDCKPTHTISEAQQRNHNAYLIIRFGAGDWFAKSK